METVIRVEHLTKRFSRAGQAVTAVDDVSFSLHAGECLGLIGESGSGKTTVVNMITRLLDPTEGRIFLNDEDITERKGAALRKMYRDVQMVFQTPTESFDPRRTLGDGIGESLRNSGMGREKVRLEVRRLLVQCGLPEEFADRYPHEVSGGQCQRAAIARAIAIKPKVLILDEATSALDVTVQKEILELLQSLKDELQMSYLFICHDIALVQAFCDRVVVMNQGKLVEEGIPDRVIADPQEEYTKNLIASVL